MQFHFIRQLVKDKTITILYIPRLFNTADIFTKALNQTAFKQYISRIGIVRIYRGRAKKLKENRVNSNLVRAFLGYIKRGYSFPTIKVEVF